MTEDNPVSGRTAGLGAGSSGGPMSERMQALLSRAAEEQLTEQRQVSAVLADLRGLVAGLGEQLRGTASSARLESLGGDVASLFTELRMATANLGERLDVLGRRVDEQAAATSEIVQTSSAGTDAVAVRVTALGEDLGSQADALDRLTASVTTLSAFPDSLAALQREVSGLHDRLAPLSEVRSGLADLTARTGAVEALRPEVQALGQKLDGVASAADVTRVRDSLSIALGERLERLETAAARPVATPDDLTSAMTPVLARLEETSEPVVGRLQDLDTRFAAVEDRLGGMAERLSAVGDAAGGVPALATDLATVVSRLDELAVVRQDLASLRTGLTALQEDPQAAALLQAVSSLRVDVEDVGARVDAVAFPTADAVATAVSQQVVDRLVDELAPRVADLVLNRVASTLVEQVADSVTTSVQNGLTERVRAANADSERRISTHVDEAVLALAEALLRRRRPARAAGATGATADVAAEPVPVADAAPVATTAAAAPAPAPAPAPPPVGEDEPFLPDVLQAEDSPEASDAVVPLDDAPAAADADAAAAEGIQPVVDERVDGDEPDDEPDDAPVAAAADEAAQVQDDEPDEDDEPVAAVEDDLPTGPTGPPSGFEADDEVETDDDVVEVEVEVETDDDVVEVEVETDDETDDEAEVEPAPSPAATTAASDPRGDAAPLVDTSPAPASAFRQFTMPRTVPAPSAPQPTSAPEPAPAVTPQVTRPAPTAPPVPASAQEGDDDGWYDDEDDDPDGPRRRPWWRPGG